MVVSGCRVVLKGPSIMITDHDIEQCPTRYEFTFTEAEIEDFAAGIVPHRVRADARAMLDFDDMCRRNAARPVRAPRKGKS
jgi:hypothetical protein